MGYIPDYSALHPRLGLLAVMEHSTARIMKFLCGATWLFVAGPSAPKALAVVPAVIPPLAAVIAVLLWILSMRYQKNRGVLKKSFGKADQDQLQLENRAYEAEEAVAMSRSAAGNITLSSLVIRQGWLSVDGNSSSIPGSAELERSGSLSLQRPDRQAGDQVQALHQGEIRPGSVPGNVQPRAILWPAMTEAAANDLQLEDPCRVESPKPVTQQRVPHLRWNIAPSLEPSNTAPSRPRLQWSPLTDTTSRGPHAPLGTPLAATAAALSQALHHR
jgi:hypothetical protein